MKWLGLTLMATAALAGCGQVGGGSPAKPLSDRFDVQVRRVGLDALYLPNALVTVTNLGDAHVAQASVQCEFLDKAGALIDVGSGMVSELAPGVPVTDTVMSAAQYQKPSSAKCRVEWVGG